VAEQAEGLYLKIACIGRAIATSSLSSVYDDRMDAAEKTSTTGTYSTAMPFARSCTARTQYFVRCAYRGQTYTTAGVTHTAYERVLRHVVRAHRRTPKHRITIWESEPETGEITSDSQFKSSGIPYIPHRMCSRQGGTMGTTTTTTISCRHIDNRI
jgi:hypothetical protein